MLTDYIRSLADLVFPQHCLGCNRVLKNSRGAVICGACWQAIKKNTPPFCRSCGRNLNWKTSHHTVCNNCLKKTVHFDRAFSPCVYDGVVKKMIHACKYSGADHISEPLAKLILDFINEYQLPPLEYFDMIIPVPLHKNRLREREFNQAELIAQHISAASGLALCTNALTRVKDTPTQTKMTDHGRFNNVRDSFTVTTPEIIQDKMIILLDDVLTTGATASEAAKELKKSGCRTVFVLSVAS